MVRAIDATGKKDNSPAKYEWTVGLDNDGDGYPDYCGAEPDCDDMNPEVHPGVAEATCDGIDNDCDVQTPDDPNGDGDPVSFCSGDCNDSNPAIYLGATEIICNAIDENCNGMTDDIPPDGEGDGITICSGDCNDANKNIHPGAKESACNEIDDNCAGGIDETEVVSFIDANLESAVRNELDKPTGTILNTNLCDLFSLYAEGNNIIHLNGLEYCTNLMVLELTSNQINDLSPLAGLTNLLSLGLASNQLSDTRLSLLSNLTNLTELDLQSNQVSDLSPLVANPGLGTGDVVSLGNNPLSAKACNEEIPALKARGVYYLG